MPQNFALQYVSTLPIFSVTYGSGLSQYARHCEFKSFITCSVDISPSPASPFVERQKLFMGIKGKGGERKKGGKEKMKKNGRVRKRKYMKKIVMVT